MPDTMTVKERWLAALHLQPVDRLPFWPKLRGSYQPAQEVPFQDMKLREIHDWIGSDRLERIPACATHRRQRTSVRREESDNVRTFVYETPNGCMEQVRQFDAGSRSWPPVAFPIKKADDIGLMTEIFEDVRVELNREVLERAQQAYRQHGDDAFVAHSIGESPLMTFVEWLAGVKNAHLLLLDYEEEVEALFDAMHRVLVETAAILAEFDPGDALWMTENTSTTLISPGQFRHYCMQHLREYAEICRSFGKPLFLHMCGHLKALLPDLETLPVHGFEAFTTPSLGNTTLLDGRTACPTKCLVGGTNAVLWTKPAGEIIETLERDLDVLPHHRGIVVTSAGVMPPLASPETIREVCEWVKQYPAHM